MEDSARAAPEVLAKCALQEYARQIIDGIVTCSGSANAITKAIAPHPGEG